MSNQQLRSYRDEWSESIRAMIKIMLLSHQKYGLMEDVELKHNYAMTICDLQVDIFRVDVLRGTDILEVEI